MITLNNISKQGLAYIAMAIDDIIQLEGQNESKGQGVWLEKIWLTPEMCYWLKKLLEEAGDTFSKESTRNILQTGAKGNILQTRTNDGLK